MLDNIWWPNWLYQLMRLVNTKYPIPMITEVQLRNRNFLETAKSFLLHIWTKNVCIKPCEHAHILLWQSWSRNGYENHKLEAWPYSQGCGVSHSLRAAHLDVEPLEKDQCAWCHAQLLTKHAIVPPLHSVQQHVPMLSIRCIREVGNQTCFLVYHALKNILCIFMCKMSCDKPPRMQHVLSSTEPPKSLTQWEIFGDSKQLC